MFERDTGVRLSLNGLHVLHPFMRPSTVLRELETVYANPQSQRSVFLFCINMIFAVGAASLFRSGSHDVPPLDYYQAAMQHAHTSVALPAEEQIQSLLLILMFSLQYDVRGMDFTPCCRHFVYMLTVSQLETSGT